MIWTLYISIFRRIYKLIKPNSKTCKSDHWHETTPCHPLTKNLPPNLTQSNRQPLKKSLKPKIPTSPIKPSHPPKNSFSINTLLQLFWEAHNQIQPNSRRWSLFFTEACIIQSTTWKAHQKNIWRRRKSNFHNFKVLFI